MAGWHKVLWLCGATLMGVALQSACATAEDFTCHTHEDCSGVEGGECEPTGYCSQPAPGCPSGREYADLSGDLTGQCVLPGEVASGTGSSSDDGGTGSGDGGTGNITVADDDADGGSTVGADGGEGTTGMPASTTDGTTGDVAPDLCEGGVVVLAEDFEGTALSALDWEVDMDGNASAAVTVGEFALSVEAAWEEGSDFWYASARPDVPTYGSLRMEVVSPPAAEDSLVMLDLFGDEDQLLIQVYEDNVVAAYWNGMGISWAAEVAYVPDQHRWLGMEWDLDDGWLELNVSEDGETWWYLDDFEIDFEVWGVGFGGGVVEDVDFEGEFAVVDNVVLCDNGT